jgi:hypothetical protein
MEIVDVFVEYPSGMSIFDSATYSRGFNQVCVSERLAAVLRELGVTEAPPEVTATIDGVPVVLQQCTDGCFSVEFATHEQPKQGPGFLLRRIGHEWSEDQRQQFGRYAHTLSAASIVGAVGYWHSTQVWTATAVFNIAMLVVFFVILFLAGMDSMNGE